MYNVWTWWGRTARRCSVDISRKWKDPLKQPKTRPKVGRAQGLENINTNLVLPPGKPRCMTYYFKLWLTICIYYLCITFQELFETLVAWSLGFSEPYTSMCRLALLCLIGIDRNWVIFLSLARYRMSLDYIIWFTIFEVRWIVIGDRTGNADDV